MEVPAGTVNTIAYSPDGRRIATGTGGHFWTPPNGPIDGRALGPGDRPATTGPAQDAENRDLEPGLQPRRDQAGRRRGQSASRERDLGCPDR